MTFNSFEFLVFFPLVVFLYVLTPQRYKWVLLLAASYYFYMCWNVAYIVLIIFSTLVDYFAARQMGKTPEKHKRKKYLYLSLFCNLGLLFLFKYFDFFGLSMELMLGQFNIFYESPYLDFLLPVGISFYTFQTLSYTIDVYNGKIKPEKHLGIFAVYVSFFPQLVAGPIERAQSLLPQFRQKMRLKAEEIKFGLLLMAWGFFKKIVIADRLAEFVNPIYKRPELYDGIDSLVATYLFAFQIYCDFSGYSDIAIGAALVMGYKLMENFRRPYFSRSVREFWGRWHISLSTWFRDYLYIPMGGGRVVKWRWYYNLMVVFIVSGLWHGAYFTFIIWGALHGAYVVAENMTRGIRNQMAASIGLSRFPRFSRFVSVVATFHLVTFTWIFFRAERISDAFIIIKNIASINLATFSDFIGHFLLSFGEMRIMNADIFQLYELRIAVYAILLMEIVHLIQERGVPVFNKLKNRPIYLRWSCYAGLVFIILAFGRFAEEQQFIYFQF